MDRRLAAGVASIVLAGCGGVTFNYGHTEDLMLTGPVSAHITGTPSVHSCTSGPNLTGPNVDYRWTSSSTDGTDYMLEITISGGGNGTYVVPLDRGTRVTVTVASPRHPIIGGGTPTGHLKVSVRHGFADLGTIDVDLGNGEHLSGKWDCSGS